MKTGTIVAPENFAQIPEGSVIRVGRKIDTSDSTYEYDNSYSIWLVGYEQKCILVNENFPHSETEDLEWFSPWEVMVVV